MKTILAICCLFAASSLYAQSTKDGIFRLDQDYKINATGTLRLSASDAKVHITGSNRATAHVKIERILTTKGFSFGHEDFNIDVSEQSGDLEIRENSSSVQVGMVGYQYEKYTIDIEAPEGINLRIRGDDGDYWIKNVDGNISLTLDDADVELTGCSGENFEFKLDDGDISMDEGKGNLDIDADDADVRIRNAKFTNVTADMDDGDLEIETSLADNGNYNIRAQDGSVIFNITQGGGRFNVRHDDGRVITEGNFEQVERSEDRTRLTLASGNARVDITSDDARVRLIKR